jgi:hypothetical protein
MTDQQDNGVPAPDFSESEIDAILLGGGFDPIAKVEEIDFFLHGWGKSDCPKNLDSLSPADRVKIASFIFQKGGLEKFPSLRVLSLNQGLLKGLSVSKWPPDFLTHAGVQSFTFRGTPPAIRSIAGFPSLKKLRLEESSAKKLPADIGKLSQLETLIAWKGLSELPESFTKLSKLKKVDFRTNKFVSLPDWFWTMDSIEEIDLADNPLAEIPVDLMRLPNLRILNLSRTPFGSIMANVQPLKERIGMVPAGPFKG